MSEQRRVVYLHGFASGPSSTKARYFRELLQTSGFRVEIPDLADGDFEHLTITAQLAVIERYAKGDAICLAGSSLGGYLAALYAARHPEVERVVLFAPAFDFAHRWAEYLGPEQVAEWRRTGVMELFHYAENCNKKLHYELLEDAGKYEAFPDFGQPALIFHGAQDDVVPARYSQEFVSTHPNANLEILDSGHELTDVLDYMGSRVLEFLGR